MFNSNSLDSVGNKIHEGAILRVYHFTGARNRKHYMYKQVGEYSEKHNAWKVYHLPIKGFLWKDYYYETDFSRSVVVESNLDIKKNPKLRD